MTSPSTNSVTIAISGSMTWTTAGATPILAASIMFSRSTSRLMNMSVPAPGTRSTYLPPPGLPQPPFTQTV